MNSITGLAETWQIEAHDSFGSIEDVDKATGGPPPQSRTIVMLYQPGLSYHPDQLSRRFEAWITAWLMILDITEQHSDGHRVAAPGIHAHRRWDILECGELRADDSLCYLAIDPQNPNTVHTGTADGGVFAITFVPTVSFSVTVI